MTQEELNYIKDAFSQIIEDIAGNPDWHEAARSVASDLGTLERELEEKVASLPSNLYEAAEECVKTTSVKVWGKIDPKEDLEGYMARANYGTGLLDGFKAGAEWMAGRGITLEGRASRRYENGLAGFVSWILFDQQKAAHLLVNQGEEADVIINIRKK